MNDEIAVVEQQLEEILHRQQKLFEKKQYLEKLIKEQANSVTNGESGSGSKNWNQSGIETNLQHRQE